MCRIKNLEDIFADELIITINDHNNRIIAAEVVGGIVSVFKSCLMNFVLDVRVAFMRNVVEVQVASIDEIGIVSGSIIDDHNKVVSVVLGEDSVEIVLDSLVFVVIV
jgi:hypothetical protein